MSYRTISVVVTDKTADSAALLAAAALSASEDGHLDVYCLGIDATRYEAMPVGAASVILESGVEEARARAEELSKWAQSVLDTDGPKITIEPVVSPQMGLDVTIARLTRFSDLIVASKPYGAGRTPIQVNVLEAELLGTAAPVLVVPHEGCRSSFDRVAVAWNESSESFNAVRGALPMLQQAKKVDIVIIDPPSHAPERSDPGGAVSLMLARHGIKSEVSILARTLPRVSEVMNRFVTEHACDLLVMGGYGHSRFRESILGGATRDMLEYSAAPLLMAH